ncbi:NADH dehydrogenase [ubiquinone] 1 alpha subcomplex subunit 11-like [Plodia interpunctella]|uniref:NADH dehydrogenase [ubiquinone] 1 alpha subcomplex subunit 11-like n=1 Tax=Plodia interpunctella TaxID=58824 RepID=UPI0023678509|nr:NADH dehydrogenase [ubiquinone] 1 alpha subcomplex subunit 11-like [Plodia interpunctella]
MMRECKAYSDTTRNYYRYYDTPDGCNIDQKVIVTTRYGFITGMIFGAYDVMMYSHAVGFSNMAKRYMKHVVPLSLMGATFSLVANGLLRYREKDDRINYFLGGFACGPLAAAYLGSGHAVLLGGLALGIVGMIKKDAIDNCVLLIPDSKPHLGTCRSWRSDYTLIRDPRDDMRHTCDEAK